MSADADQAPDTLTALLGAGELVDACVHCGYCLPSCPTYVLWARETDSPRGRIVLIGDAIQAGGQISDEMVKHFDSCLGCLACVSSCPSGVRYDELIELVRPEVERQHARSAGERALRRTLFETIPHPARLQALAPALSATKRFGTRLLPARLATLTEIAPRPPSRAQLRKLLPEHTDAVGARRGRVALLLGCVQRVFFAEVHRATLGVLAAEGYEVLAPQAPGCCGALELHAGAPSQARARASAIVEAFGQLGELDHIVVNAAGCGAALKHYGALLGTPAAHAFADKVLDISELLAAGETRAPRGPLPLRVAYHDACHLRHAQQLRAQPRAMLAAIPGLELLEVSAAEADVCCGSAGTYNMLSPEPAAALGARKATTLLATGAHAIATGNPGCAAQLDMHLRKLGRPLPVHHPVELVWRSIQAADQA